MGMYTEVFFRANLKPDLPEGVEVAIAAITNPLASQASRSDLPAHELFDCERWDMLGTGRSAYFPSGPEPSVIYDEYVRNRSLTLHGNLKNYCGEIDKFFDWIDPYVDAEPGEFLGYSLYEDVDPGTPPFLYFKQGES